MASTDATPSLAARWWWFTLFGAACMAIGVATLVWPDKSLLVVGVLTGVYLIVAAVSELVDALTGPAYGRTYSVIVGVIALIAGLICIRRPDASLTAIVIALGVFLIVEGVLTALRAFGDETARWTFVRGVLDLLVGVLILAWPDIGLAALAAVFAVTILVRGAFTAVLGLRLRAVAQAETAAPATSRLV